MTGPVQVSVGRSDGLQAIAKAQQGLIDAIAAGDLAGIQAATADFRLALHQTGTLQTLASQPENRELVESLSADQQQLRSCLQARLGQARQALDALGLQVTHYGAHGIASYRGG